jgi:hypothetical protein
MADSMADFVFFRGDVNLGALTLTGGEFPWHHGTFSPTAEFENVRPLFDELFESVNGGEGNFPEIWSRINDPPVYLHSLFDGETYHTFILHIREERFRLRLGEADK